MKYKTGEEFLNKLYTDMHKNDIVMHTALKQDTKEEAIKKYLDRLEHAHDIASKSEHNLDALKEFYYQKYIIKELPESYIEHQKKIARERGLGDIDIDDNRKKEMLKAVKEDQKKSLDVWIEYFISNDSIYPMWFKNYAFQGMISLGIFDKEKCTFTKRTDKTTAPFIELNREVLSLVYDTLKSEIGENEVTEEYAKALENGESFKKLYTYYLTKQNYKANSDETDGIWIKYNRGSDYHILCDTLKEKNTGWCIAGEEVAKRYIKEGSFYIYYTKGDNLEYTNPRIAIRMEYDSIAEVRGVGPDQNIEPNMLKIADQKLDEFQDKELYQKKVHDMEMLTIIESKVNNKEELTNEDLIFLYEIEDKIEGFGYQKDPRIEEIKEKRNIKKDLAYIYNVKPKNIGTRISDLQIFSLNPIYIYYGDLKNFDYTLISKNKLKNLKAFIGNINLRHLLNSENIVLPEVINGDLNLSDIETSKGLILPEKLNGSLDLRYLKSAKDLVLPKIINGNLSLNSLKSAEGLVLPEVINGNIYLNSLGNAKELVLPEVVNGYIFLESLTNANQILFPKKTTGNIYLHSLGNLNSFVIPERLHNKVLCLNPMLEKTVLFDEEYSKYYDEEKNKQENKKVR